jgi:nucleotide-binding universal stress UspA family protein
MSNGPDKVVVGYDGSPDAKRALAFAAALARSRNAPLRLVVGLGEFRVRRVTELDVEWVRAHEADLAADARAAVDALGFEGATLELSHAAPVPALLAAADETSVLVVGSRGHSRVAHVLAGSVSQHVARHAPCTVVVVREPADPAADTVLVGVDASSGCRPALELAFDHASRLGLSVRAMYVSQYAHPRPAGRHAMSAEDANLAAAEPLIVDAIKPYADKHPDVVVHRELLAGSAPRTLADASEHAALVVVGSRGLGAFESLLLGSVGQALLTHARCPVAIAR